MYCIHIGQDAAQFYVEIISWHSKALNQTSLFGKLIHNGHTMTLTLVHIYCL